MKTFLQNILLTALLFTPHNFSFDSEIVLGEVAKKELYYCPMHPHVHSFEPGVCPICGMKLEKMPEGKQTSFNGIADETKEQIPGRKSVYLDEMQFQLSGSALTKVKRQDLVSRIPAGGKVLSKKSLTLYVAERDIQFVAVGSLVQATASMLSGKLLKGKVSNMDTLLDPMTKTLRVEVELNSNHEGLRPEGSIFAEIERSRKNILIIPREAVLSFGAYSYVFLMDENKTKLTPQKITTGIDDEKYIEVISGLSENQTISSGPNFLIDSESRIQVGRGQ